MITITITGVLDVLHAVVDRLPSPAAAMMKTDGPFLGRIVDSWYVLHRTLRYVTVHYTLFILFVFIRNL